MKSRTNVHQELMRQQIIEEEKNSHPQKYGNAKSVSLNKLNKFNNANRTIIIKTENPQKNYLITNAVNLNKRQRSASYTLSSELKTEPFSPNAKSPMDLAFSELGNDDVLDWNQIEPSITATSDISAQDIMEQINRNDGIMPELCIQNRSPEGVLVQQHSHIRHHNQTVSQHHQSHHSHNSQQSPANLKSSTSCPANMANPFIFQPHQQQHQQQHSGNSNTAASSTLLQTSLLLQNFHQNSQQQQQLNVTSTSNKQAGGNNSTLTPSSSSRTTPNSAAAAAATSSSSFPSNIPDDQRLQWVRDRNKKDCHNRIERKRRDYINNQIQELGQLLPEKLFLSTESKRNKGGILKNSVIYIQQMQDSLNCMQNLLKETQVAETVITSFYKHIQGLQEQLSSAGLSIPAEQEQEQLQRMQDWFSLHQHNSQVLHKLNSTPTPWQPMDEQQLQQQQQSPQQQQQSPQQQQQQPQQHHQQLRLSHDLTSPPGVKEEAFSVDYVLNSSSLNRTHTVSSGGSSAGTTPSAGAATNFNSPSTSVCGGGGSGVCLTGQTGKRAAATGRPRVLVSAASGESRPMQLVACDSPVLSSILGGRHATHVGATTGTTGSGHHGLSNSVPDSGRNTFLTMDNDRWYAIPISGGGGAGQSGHLGARGGGRGGPAAAKKLHFVATGCELKRLRGSMSGGEEDDADTEESDPVLSHMVMQQQVQQQQRFLNRGRQSGVSGNFRLGTSGKAYRDNDDADEEADEEEERQEDDPDDCMMDAFELDDIVME